ncbi:unnamed protein product [Adineta steineri]|uniref:Uncharacterized protein n=1 Tax=Adineta steineri TaxID=433720 RepID=A0A819D2N4_9BILA|nr:unnamed protein product [Adineta steineri]CAF3830056.1 unnamed protein product [Adineta steineri]
MLEVTLDMTELDEIRSITSQQHFNTVTSEDRQISQSEVITTSSNESDDEPLLYIGPVRNNRKFYSHYYFEILAGSIIIVSIIIIIAGGYFFTRDSIPPTRSTRFTVFSTFPRSLTSTRSNVFTRLTKWNMFTTSTKPNMFTTSTKPNMFTTSTKPNMFTTSTEFPESNITCNQESGRGKSCATYDSNPTLLIRLDSLLTSKYWYFSYGYIAQANTSIITFVFAQRSRWNLDDLSIYDSLNNIELIEDGSFEGGSLYAYCECGAKFRMNELTARSNHSGSYSYEPSSFFSLIKLSQAVDTIVGRNYNISFWLKNQGFGKNSVSVYMSVAKGRNSEIQETPKNIMNVSTEVSVTSAI